MKKISNIDERIEDAVREMFEKKFPNSSFETPIRPKKVPKTNIIRTIFNSPARASEKHNQSARREFIKLQDEVDTPNGEIPLIWRKNLPNREFNTLMNIKKKQKGLLLSHPYNNKVTSLDIVKLNEKRKVFAPNTLKYSEEYFKEKRFSATANPSSKQNLMIGDVKQKVFDIQK